MSGYTFNKKELTTLALNTTSFIDEFSREVEDLIENLEENSELKRLVLEYYAYVNDESKNTIEFMWAMNSIIHFCLNEGEQHGW